MNRSYKIIKRFLDIVLSLFGLIILSPLIILISVLVFFINGKPIVFSQNRPGLNEKPFTLYKFRTMENKDNQGKGEILLPDDARLTELGKFLRGTSLDELPTLVNVLYGDMSIIGPRPLLIKYLERYDDLQRRRHEVKPGITGWAQVNGRNLLSWDERFCKDVWYIENQSLMLDIKIFLMTIYKVLKREGISSKDQATGEEFKGNKSNES